MNKYLTIALLVLFAACKKNDDKQYIPLNADLKKNYSFKEGSYWIYRDSLSGREDSFCVTGYSQRDQYIQSAANVYETVNMVIYQYPASNPYSDSASWVMSLNTGGKISLDYFYQMQPLESFHITDLNYDYPFATNNFADITIHPKLVVRGAAYANVAECAEGQDSYFLKDSVGFVIIKTHYETQSHVWELERYHINY
ncbi:hypothetical protein [Taibaiella soli]|uniref:Uncharacterized protein n=1 Tax=Taibaiella soli TaxID=1649169 RepID=A0A2W2BCA0_9BACT|nr:hypothetical protein [Taibaiella soli]PZF73849.1 hypothetical protein DN068_05770 [Taibaiella soli]